MFGSVNVSANSLPDLSSADAMPEKVEGNVARIAEYSSDAGRPIEELWFNTEGQLYRKETHQPGSITLITRYRYTPAGELIEWYQTGVDNQRLWSYQHEYDSTGRLHRVIAHGHDGAAEYIEEYTYADENQHEMVRYDALGIPQWVRKVRRSGDLLEWELLQPNGGVFSQGAQVYENGLLRSEEVRDGTQAIIERIEYDYDESGRILHQRTYDAAQLVQRRSYAYMNSFLEFSRTIEPQQSGRMIQHEIVNKDQAGNWTNKVHTVMFEQDGEVEVVSSETRRRRIEYRE
ncbi:MAG: hypothetical protein ACOCVC_03400 [Spirochaeta sp.]